MNNLDHVNFFMKQQQQRLDNWERNQNMLHRQLFIRAEQANLIRLLPDSVEVLDVNGTIAHFKYHPDIMSPALSYAINTRNKTRLISALSAIRRQVF